MRSKTTIGSLGLVALVAAALTGCVMPDKVTDMQKNLSDIQSDIQQIRAGQQDAKERLTALEQRSTDNPDQATKADLADVTIGIDQLSRDVSIVDERLNDMGRRLDRLSQQVQQTRESSRPAYDPYGQTAAPAGGAGDDLPPPVIVTEGDRSSGAGVPGAVPDPDELYNTAYADFSKGNYALAVSGFEEFHEKFPGSPVADNALYWVGECHFSQGDFTEAIRAFDRMLEAYPSSDKAAASNLKKGLAYLEQNQVGQAIIQLRFVVDEYPRSDEAKIARDKLTSLGAPS